jgi:membrane protein required for beta-lactamase induction
MARSQEVSAAPKIPFARRPSLGALLLALVPFVSLCFSVPLWDRIQPTLLGLPFNLFWLIVWIILSSVCLALARRIEDDRERHETHL